jgi:DNA-binding CsgD family transcriptional regulator
MDGSCLTTDTFAKIIDDLYAGALDDKAWNRAILAIADTVRASGAVLLALNPRSGQLLRYENHRLDPEIMVEYQKHWTYEDIRREAFLNIATCEPVTEQMLRFDVHWNRSTILNEFLMPADVPHFMPAWLHKAPHKVVTLSFQGTRKRGPFDAKDLTTYKRVLPHIARALEIRDRLEQAQVRTETLSQRLAGSLTFGVVVLDAEGKVLESNPVAQEILRTGDGIRCQPGRALRFRGAAAGQFARLIATSMSGVQASEGLLRVARSSSPALSAVIMPLPRNTVAWIGAEPRRLVLLFDPERRVRVSATLIARDLEISASEAQIAAMIADGKSTIDVAERRGVTQGTVRAQLKSIFRKTNIHSQAELVRRIALGPGVHA